MEVKYRPVKDGLNPNDFRPMEPKAIPFNLEWDGINFSGTLTPPSDNPAYGVHIGFLVQISGNEAMTLTIQDGEWIMPGAPKNFATVLGEWIEGYYK
jgi:hypothetical protein